MAITLKTNPTDKVIELGGGANPLIRPNVDVRACYDANGNPTVDFTANFEEPLPIQDQEWDAVYCQYTLEHISYRKVKGFLKEVFRILKPGGKAVFVVPNTEAQLKWIQSHPEGWDGKDAFDSCSCVLFGDQDYAENSHKLYLSPMIAQTLFSEAGFERILTQPYGERDTDMVVEVVRPKQQESPVNTVVSVAEALKEIENKPNPSLAMSASEKFDRSYFNGGGKVGGYAREGMWDFPCHELTAQHVLARKPESVLEIGAARGYVLKRLQDAGVRSEGLEVSKHCFMTRVVDGIKVFDLCSDEDWPYENKSFDLCLSVAALEHIPENRLERLFSEMERVCKRGLHGIDFGGNDDGFDKTHVSLHPKDWWQQRLPLNHEAINKEELEQGVYPDSFLKGDGKVKLNIGCFTTMYHYGWTNIDIHDLNGWAQAYQYNFCQLDVRQGLPYQTGEVDLIMMCHFFEHLTYKEGLTFLRECRRVLKPEGAMRIIVPDLWLLTKKYKDEMLNEFDEINEGCANTPFQSGKFWELVHSGHSAAYDSFSMNEALRSAGFSPFPTGFRVGANKQILKETLDMLPCLSLYTEAFPLMEVL